MLIEIVIHAHLRIQNRTILLFLHILYFLYGYLMSVTERSASLKHPKVIEQVMEQGVGWVAFVVVSISGKG